jgi:YD repeat-containing protein
MGMAAYQYTWTKIRKLQATTRLAGQRSSYQLELEFPNRLLA